jgi:GDPmannose 4,6-dehydratase
VDGAQRNLAPSPADSALTPAARRGGGRRALITGITGQDGSFLAELLLDLGYHVVGALRRAPEQPLGLVEPLRERLELVRADLTDLSQLRRAVELAAPAEIYHLAAPSFVPDSWLYPAETVQAITGATATLLCVVRDLDPTIRVYNAASSMIFGAALESPQNESTACHPRTPYAVAKLAGHQLVGLMREHDGLHASSGITFNHESERRPEAFVTRKVSMAAAAVSLGLQDEVQLGDLSAVRDWSFAGDVMRGAWLMLQQDRPEDYVLASGVGHTVAELAQVAFAFVGLDAERHVRSDPSLARAAEATPSVGDPSKARRELGWEARWSFQELVHRMVSADLERLRAAAGRP